MNRSDYQYCYYILMGHYSSTHGSSLIADDPYQKSGVVGQTPEQDCQHATLMRGTSRRKAMGVSQGKNIKKRRVIFIVFQ